MAILEFIIAIIFICLLISLFVSWIIDIYANKMNRKGKFLQEMLTNLMGQDGITNWSERLYQHPLIKTLSVKKGRLSSYIPPNVFSQVITDLIIVEGKNDTDHKYTEKENSSDEGLMKKIEEGIDKMPEGDLKQSIHLFFEQSKQESGVFFSSLENWYNEYMVRVNHSYKRLLKLPLCVLGIIVALAFQIDAVRIASSLWTDTQMRSSVANAASEFIVNNPDLDKTKLSEEFFTAYKESMTLPVGWAYEISYYKELQKKNEGKFDFGYWFLKLVGLFLTGMIASFGAPFWYDALQKIVGLKKSLKVKNE